MDSLERRVGKRGPWSGYIQYIATETSLPTFWTEEERGEMWGTSLGRHCAAKMVALRREFESLVGGMGGLWWGDVWRDGGLEFGDWVAVDGMWRSRAMELAAPAGGDGGVGVGIGGSEECLVPVVDMANHSGETRVGYTLVPSPDGLADKGEDGLWAALTLDCPITDICSNSSTQTEPEEITISYGANKSAAEMIFSYGFLDSQPIQSSEDSDDIIPDARGMMLGWTFPSDDPLRFEKASALGLEPGIQLYTPHPGGSEVRFVGAAVWAMAINEEDGLRIVRNKDIEVGEDPEVEMWFKDVCITSKTQLIDVLKHDRAALVFRARAYGYVYLRIEEEIRRIDELVGLRSEMDSDEGLLDDRHSQRREMCARLRELEYAFLKRAFGYFVGELEILMRHPDVLMYPVLMEQGKELPPLTNTEQWDRFEREYDEENRRGYLESLEDGLIGLDSEGSEVVWRE